MATSTAPNNTHAAASTSDSDPIAALATAPGAAAVAIIRISGKGSHDLLRQVLTKGPAPGERELRFAKIIDPKDLSVVDEAMVVFFAGPRSYTGEDSAEVHCHGGPFVVRLILSLLYRLGFRAAEPGEFTRRAFLNGKLDLTAAEGIRELVEAQSHQQWVAARHLATGRLRSAIEDLRQTLIAAMAYLEAQIDFPDEGDTAHLHLGHVRTQARDAEAKIKRLIGSYGMGRVATRGLMVALFGAPNAGKSTLLNELLGRQRAIVTPIAGTTRDYIEEACLIQGRLVRLVDMAGVRDDPDPIEAIGVEAAQRLAREADLVLFLAAADAPSEAMRMTDKWVSELTPPAHLKILTKIDLGKPAWASGKDWTGISCASGEGLENLRQLLADKVDAHVGNLDKEASFVTSARHLSALNEAADALARFFASDTRGDYVELLAFELQQAIKALKAIIGDVGNEDILDKVFSDFCIGK